MAMNQIVIGHPQISAIVEFDSEGRPAAIRWHCRNERCCPRQEGKVAIHRRIFTGPPDLVGRVESFYEPRKRAVDLMAGR